jgi:hypothetical protein
MLAPRVGVANLVCDPGFNELLGNLLKYGLGACALAALSLASGWGASGKLSSLNSERVLRLNGEKSSKLTACN